MPLLRRQVLQKAPVTERFKDDDEVFFCQPTGEIFSNYEDYFHRVMLISSMVWSCSMTGRPNLTYGEALESEKAARKLLRTFPAAVRGPFLLIASHTKRSSINEMHEDVYGFVKDQLFKGETVDAFDVTRNIYRRSVIINVVLDSTQSTRRLMYHVRAEDSIAPKMWYSVAGGLRRDRSSLTRDKCKLFLKQHVEAGPGGQLRIKQDSLDRFVRAEGWTDAQVFLGNVPDFEQSKKLKLFAERSVTGSQPNKKKKPAPKADGSETATGSAENQPAGTKRTKKSKNDATSTTSSKTGVQESKGGSKQKTSKQSATKQTESYTEDASSSARANNHAQELTLQNQKVEQEALLKKRAEEEKVLLLQQITLALKRYNVVLDDQELTDQRPMPPVRPVRPLIAPNHFSNFVFILEFMNSFTDLLGIRGKFSGGLTMHMLERALLLREVNGPLSDILQVLLSAVFTQQVEEENEVDVRYERIENLASRQLTVPDQVRARDTVLWCERHYCTKLHELPMDSMTVSELLRLHFLASGALVEEKASKHRFYNRGGYGSADDPGLRLVHDCPHILRALRSYSVYQLPIGDVVQILCCLIHQLLTYGGVREIVEERIERARKSRISYQTNRYAQRRLTVRAGSQKNQAREDMKRELAAFEGDDAAKEEYRGKRQQQHDEMCALLEVDTQRQLRLLQTESEKLKEDFFDYQIYLGTDRCFRSYWLFESLPGLFVEHDRKFAGRCADRATVHRPGLANCAPEQRRKYISKAIMTCAGTDGVAGLLDAKAIAGGSGQVEEVYEQLLTLGSSKLELMQTNEPNGEGPQENGVPVSSQTTNRQLMMCTADPEDCPVHTPSHETTIAWGYYATADELDALIRSLNVRGIREKALRDTLECERDLIVTHIEKCPLEKLSVADDGHHAALLDIVNRNQKRYDAPNFSHDPGTEPNEILEAVFREHLLELEAKITIGYLGVMRVQDRDRWRDALEANSYDPQTDEPLQWGPRRLEKLDENEPATDGAQKEEVPEQESDDESDSGRVTDPGFNLLDTSVSQHNETLTEENMVYPLHESETLRKRVQLLARALLQVAQCIDQKFLRHPFGPKKDHKDRHVMMHKHYQGQKNLVQWEMSLMRSTGYAQLFLHYNVLYDAIHWSRSAERIRCMICRRKGDPLLTLLCDECNRACHTYCLKPKLKEVPAGDWYCMRCRPENFKQRRAPAKKKKIFKWNAEEEEDEEEDDDEQEVEEEQEAVEEEEEEGEADDQQEQAPEDGSEGRQWEEQEDARSEQDDAEEEEDEADESISNDSESGDDGADGDDGSDEDYRASGWVKMAPVAKKKNRPKPKGVKVKPMIVATKTSSGRNKRNTAMANGSYRSDGDHDVDEDDDDDYGWPKEDGEFANGGRAAKRRRRDVETKRAAGTNAASERPRRARQQRPTAANGQTRKATTSRGRKTTSGTEESDEEEDEEEGREEEEGPKIRVSARSSKGQRKRRSSMTANGDGADALTPSRRSRRTGDDLPLNSVALYTLIDDILKHPDSWPFNRPVSAKEVPDYYAVIKTPMDFARVKSKLNMGDYKINEQMLSDVQLVFRNCDLYNTDETDVYRIGRQLERYVVKRCKELSLPFLPSDMQKPHGGTHPNGPQKLNGK